MTVVFLRPGSHLCRSLQAMRDDPFELFFQKARDSWSHFSSSAKQTQCRAVWDWIFCVLGLGIWCLGVGWEVICLFCFKQNQTNLGGIHFRILVMPCLFMISWSFEGLTMLARGRRSWCQPIAAVPGEVVACFLEKPWMMKTTLDGSLRLMSLSMCKQKLFRQTVFVAIFAIAESVLSDQLQREILDDIGQHRCLPAPCRERTASQKPLSLNSESHDICLTNANEPFAI